MHMADALISPAVGGAMWAVSAGAIAFCSAKIRSEADDRKIPLMGVLGAFLFAAQMINFSIPATGSSGHLGGGILLSILLGPCAAFITISSVLVVQAMFFADGGLLALGCNIFNLGFIPAFIVYPLIYKTIAGANPGRNRIIASTMASAIIGLQLGSFSVVLETLFSGISALPFSTFALLMQPIHLVIGIVEGMVTVAIITFVHQARPEIVMGSQTNDRIPVRGMRTVLVSFLLAALATGGILSAYASKNPDGLEWAISRATGKENLQGPAAGIHASTQAIQKRTAILPDYSFNLSASRENGRPGPEKVAGHESETRLGSAVSGIAGVLLTLFLTFLGGYLLKKREQAT